MRLPALVWALLATLPLTAGAWTAVQVGARAAKVAADGTYVRVDSFNTFRAQLTLQQTVQQGREAWRDSLIAQLYRACQRHGDCP